MQNREQQLSNVEEVGVRGIVFDDDSSFVSNRDRKSLDSSESVNLERCIAERETVSITMGSEEKSTEVDEATYVILKYLEHKIKIW